MVVIAERRADTNGQRTGILLELLQQILGGLVRRVSLDGNADPLGCQHGQRRKIVEGQRAGTEQVVEEHQRGVGRQEMAVAFLALEIGPANRTTAARLVRDDDVLADDLAFCGRALYGTSGQVPATARPGRCDNFDRGVGCPGGLCHYAGRERGKRQKRCRNNGFSSHVYSSLMESSICSRQHALHC